MGTQDTADLSRRNFLRGAALAGVGLSAAGLLGACAPKAPGASESGGPSVAGAGSANDVTWTKETDVVVVGFGGAGAAAAIEAKRAGAEVIVCELNAQGGGSTIANGGFILMGGTDLHKKFGLEDSTENFYNYLMAAAGENANEEAIRLVADSSPDLYRWCVECGMDFESGDVDTENHLGGSNAGFSLGYSGNEMAPRYAAAASAVPRGHMPKPGSSGKDMFAALQQAVEAAGIEVLYEMPGTRLLTDDAGRVVGVAAGKSKEEEFIKARKGVVLTCGGFVDNETMLNAFYPFVNKRGPALTTAGSENGSGILMGMALGADTFGMGCFQIGNTIVTNSDPLAKGVLVNEMGRRIVAEDEYNSFIGKAIIQAPTSKCYLIVDDATLKEGVAAAAHGAPEPVASAETLEGLAEAIGVNASVLQSTFDFYSESVSLGDDREFGKHAKYLKVPEGTLHAIDKGSETCYTASCGGLRIDLDAQVLTKEGEAIPGLFAAGRNAGTIFGWYMGSGSSMADVLTFGRIAGQKAAAAQSVA